MRDGKIALLPAKQPDVRLVLFHGEINRAVVGRESQTIEMVRRNGEDLVVFPGPAVHREDLSAGAKKDPAPVIEPDHRAAAEFVLEMFELPRRKGIGTEAGGLDVAP